MVNRRTLLKTIPAACLTMALPAPSAVASANPAAIDPGDILNKMKVVVATLLGEVPIVGSMLAMLVNLFWPFGGKSAWEQVRAQVEAMIDAKIERAMFGMYVQKLDGLAKAFKLYLGAVVADDKTQMLNYFDIAHFSMTQFAEELNNPQFEWTFAPLYAVLGQFHVALLRDAVLHGRDWGWNAASYRGIVDQTKTTIDTYCAHLDDLAERYKSVYKKNVPASAGRHRTAIYNAWQPYHQARILLISDFRVLLEASDPVRNPDGKKEMQFEDVFSPAYGTADDCDYTCERELSGDGVRPLYSAPLADISQIHVEYFNATPRVVDVSYPEGKGPLKLGKTRVDSYGLIALPENGVEKQTFQFPPSTPGKRFRFERARVSAGSIPTGLVLIDDEGTQTVLWTRGDLSAPTFDVLVPGRRLTTLNMWTRSAFYNDDLSCIIFGFSRDPEWLSPDIKAMFYVAAITEPNTGSRMYPLDISDDLEARRDAFWRDISNVSYR